MSAAAPSRLYAGRAEAWNLAMPALACAVLVAAYAGGIPLGDFSNRRWLDFVQSIFFLSIIHNAFGIDLLFGVPEIRELVRTRPGFFGLNIWLEALIVAVVWYVLFFWLFQRIAMTIYAVAVPATLIAIELHHSVKQTLGLSVLYNEKLARGEGCTGDQRAALRRTAVFERMTFDVLLVLLVTSIYLHWLPQLFSWQVAASKATCALSLVAVLVMLVNTFRFPGGALANKFKYQLRCLYFPLASVSFYGGFMMTAVHGMENLYVYRHMCANSRERRRYGRRIVLWASCAAVGVFCLVRDDGTHGLGHLLRPYAGALGPWFPVIGALSPAVGFAHFYLDRWLFRMRDPRCREIVGPLLTGPGTP